MDITRKYTSRKSALRRRFWTKKTINKIRSIRITKKTITNSKRINENTKIYII